MFILQKFLFTKPPKEGDRPPPPHFPCIFTGYTTAFRAAGMLSRAFSSWNRTFLMTIFVAYVRPILKACVFYGARIMSN